MAKTKMMKVISEEVQMPIVALYMRVSTDRQAEEGYSISIQEERLVAYTKSLFGDQEIKTIKYIDDGYSGGSLDRPRMQELIDDAKNRRITHVICLKLDRLSRSQRDTLYLIEEVFLTHNITFISTQESFNTATAFGRAVVGILSVFAQLERENIFERTRSGMQKRVEAGFWPGGGGTPFGYDYDQQQGILVPNADAEIVRKVFDMFIGGAGTQRIANTFGLKYNRLCYNILTRKTYCGYIVYNGVEYKGRHKPIITEAVYERAMELMQQRSTGKLNTETKYLLSGIVYCGVCGAKMRYQKWGKECRLICYSHQSSKPYLVKDPSCDNEDPWADDVERAILMQFAAAISKKAQGVESEYAQEEKSVLRILEAQEERQITKLKRLYNLYATSNDEVLLETINETKDDLEQLRKRIQDEIEQGSITQQHERRKVRFANILDAWDSYTQEEKRETIRECLEKVVITHRKIDLFFRDEVGQTPQSPHLR